MSTSAGPRCAIVTGTSAGIGAAVTAELLRRGWTVVGVARRAVAFADARYVHFRVDLANLSELTRIAEAQLAQILRDPQWARIGLVNNAASPALLGPVQAIEAGELLALYAVNLAAPVWLMGFVSRHTAPSVALRVVNVSSGAAVHAFPGMAAYSSAKAGLRMAGMVLAEEWASAAPHAPHRANAAIVSYEPGIVDTEMQDVARSRPVEAFPWVSMFSDFAAQGRLVPARVPAEDIVSFLEGDAELPFSERRL